jgi:hypothetical protein
MGARRRTEPLSRTAHRGWDDATGPTPRPEEITELSLACRKNGRQLLGGRELRRKPSRGLKVFCSPVRTALLSPLIRGGADRQGGETTGCGNIQDADPEQTSSWERALRLAQQTPTRAKYQARASTRPIQCSVRDGARHRVIGWNALPRAVRR